MVDTVRTRKDLQQAVSDWRRAGLTIGLVPTMGALHAGHLDLVRAAKQRADKVIATVFVNPTQFAAHEDLGRYPRDEASDVAMLAEVNCDLLYAPTVSEIYPDGFDTQITVGGVSARLEGTFRPHFFAGVATVVGKLFLQAKPDFAFFGEKDWQQLQVVTKLAKDLDMGVDVIPVQTRREESGLAMSSRNAYLSDVERQIAPKLKMALDHVREIVRSNPAALQSGLDEAKASLLTSGFSSVDYLEACHAQTLAPWQVGDPLRVLAAVWLGKTRLIDNCG